MYFIGLKITEHDVQCWNPAILNPSNFIHKLIFHEFSNGFTHIGLTKGH